LRKGKHTRPRNGRPQQWHKKREEDQVTPGRGGSTEGDRGRSGVREGRKGTHQERKSVNPPDNGENRQKSTRARQDRGAKGKEPQRHHLAESIRKAGGPRKKRGPSCRGKRGTKEWQEKTVCRLSFTEQWPWAQDNGQRDR